MSARPGEDLAVILFADVRYILNLPTSKPVHDRFNRESYVYLFENATERQARIQIANHVGTQDQDALDGSLDGVRVQYSFKQPTLISFTIDRIKGHEWHLPSFDLRNEQKFLYRLHTVDIYLWTNEDAIQLLNAIRRVLPQEQITILNEPVAPNSYYSYFTKNAGTHRVESVTTTDQLGHTRKINDSQLSSQLGPPISATPNTQQISNYTPLSYNPAAPPAPEAILHRERTPPIDDDCFNNTRINVSSNLRQSSGLGETNYRKDVNGPLNQLEQPGHTPPTTACNLDFKSSTMQPNKGPHRPSLTDSNINYLAPRFQRQVIAPMSRSGHPNVPITQNANNANLPNTFIAPHIMMSSSNQFSSDNKFSMTSSVDDPKYHFINEIPKLLYPKKIDTSSSQTPRRAATHHTPSKSIISFKASAGKLEEHASRFERGVGNFFKSLERKIG